MHFSLIIIKYHSLLFCSSAKASKTVEPMPFFCPKLCQWHKLLWLDLYIRPCLLLWNVIWSFAIPSSPFRIRGVLNGTSFPYWLGACSTTHPNFSNCKRISMQQTSIKQDKDMWSNPMSWDSMNSTSKSTAFGWTLSSWDWFHLWLSSFLTA